jgi:hypothetical protein
MSSKIAVKNQEATTVAVMPTLGQRVTDWMHDPMASAVAATCITIMAMGFVVSGLWIVNFALS